MTATVPSSPPTTRGACATLACIWEATAPKPGNVYRGADFEDLSYVDFLTSAAVIGPVFELTSGQAVGEIVLEAVRRTRVAVATNTNLGMLLLLAPLASVGDGCRLAAGIAEVLESLSQADAVNVYEAIRLAQPGGLGEVDEADVNDSSAVEISLLEAMRLAADRDLVARQYTNNFQEAFWVAELIAQNVEKSLPLGEAIVHSFLQLLADFPDSLIMRKCGRRTAEEVSAQAASVLSQGNPGEPAYEDALQNFDFSLRVDGHRRNPGTSADLIAAALFVLLREERLAWPIRFYRCEATQS